MRFIPKKKEVLTEADTNPLDVNSVDLTYDEQYVQAIMKAVASESSAIVEYEQILAIEPHVTSENLVNIFHDTLEDIKNEEIKHISQLNTKLAEAPSLKDGYKDGEEEADSGVDKENEEENTEDNVEEKEEQKESIQLTEAVIAGRYYAPDNIMDALSDRFKLSDEQYEEIRNIVDVYGNGDDVSAEDMNNAVQKIAQKYEFSDDEIPELEAVINSTIDPREDRKTEFNDELAFDINTLEEIMNSLSTSSAQQRVNRIIDELKAIEYDGASNKRWNVKYHGDKSDKEWID